jgi:hypothetical protein
MLTARFQDQDTRNLQFMVKFFGKMMQGYIGRFGGTQCSFLGYALAVVAIEKRKAHRVILRFLAQGLLPLVPVLI